MDIREHEEVSHVDFKTVDNVRKALENPKYKWRTIGGVSAETKLPMEDVLVAISKLSDEVVKATRSSDNMALFTTRRHFHETAAPWEKLLGAIKNRIA